MLSDRAFIIDAVAHAFTLTKENFAHRGHAGAVTEPVSFGYATRLAGVTAVLRHDLGGP